MSWDTLAPPAHAPWAADSTQPPPLAAEGGALSGIEEGINSVFAPIEEAADGLIFAEWTLFGISFPWIVAWLVIAAGIFTIYFGLIQFGKFRLALRIARGQYTRDDEPGEITHFQALSSALSGTVGLGNIAGVGVAMVIGGAGATFWMIIAGLLGMCTKFVECTLGVKYREIHADGTVSGGPMYYLRKGMAERFPNGVGRAAGKVMAVGASVFLLFFALAGGNMFQANQTFAQVQSVTGGADGLFGGDGAALIFGLVLASVVALVIIGGIKSIGRVTEKLVPAMGIVYVLACLTVILVNIDQVPSAVNAIISGAFNPQGVAGGVVGVLIVGFQRAAFSNEAGVGSSPIAHAAVKTKHPVTEGFVALLEPFVDTVIVCTMTALTIIIANTQLWRDGQATVMAGGDAPDGVTITSASFETVLPWFPYVLTIAVILFAVSTMITWAYYGQKAWTFLFGKSRGSEITYKAVYCFFIIVGTVLTLGPVLNFADATLFVAALFNIAGLYFLAPIVKREVKDYLSRLRSGEIVRITGKSGDTGAGGTGDVEPTKVND
ncbi:AGCS family alanine or glycine:cation symporter [Actinoalloteichus hoggarensis]|uniref:Amino-acid carrier protein AlsT n=1 Tax=Actinoalloteichus hoggarensis TaxID=1470176 RepID=A0A221WCP8_9PSEU|nr:alanine/glycine:cation symporter family protein [Actinoalloteichus hoggarensis]ASO23047.1 Amino-acid carrier protein AlsT [Actinoalloteichus hoggarensis]MBB5922652.1 AGCS family alanine or glycine:cation symporter [Actinoalloteichus hoggarensis]